MKQIVNVDLTTKATDWTPPVLSFGESLELALYFTKDVNGNPATPNFNFGGSGAGAKAGYGPVDARPLGGQFALQFGPNPQTSANTTALLDYNAKASAVSAAINALSAVTTTYGSATVQFTNGSWLLHFSGSLEVPIQVVQNGLWPVSVGRVSAWQVDSRWVQEVRLVQGPYAFTSDWDTVLAEAPSVTEVKAGGASGTMQWDELQQLYLPPDFQGAYVLKQGDVPTAQLGPTDGPSDIQAALIASFGNTFTVTLPTSYHFLIDFGGQYTGAAQPLLTVEVVQTPPPALTLTLAFNTGALASALRGSTGSITAPLEVRIWAAEDGGPVTEQVVFVLPVIVQRPLIFPELEDTPQTNWLYPFSPKSYIPFGAENVLTGQQFFPAELGDGSTTSFAIAHGLGTEYVYVFVRENSDGGRQRVDGTDFSVTITNANSVTVTALTGAPAAGAWIAVVVSARTVAAFASGLTVTPEQVVPGVFGGANLAVDLSTLDTRVSNLETLLPSTAALPASSGSAPSNGTTIALTATSGIVTTPRDASGNPITATAILPKPGAYLLPAIHAGMVRVTSASTGSATVAVTSVPAVLIGGAVIAGLGTVSTASGTSVTLTAHSLAAIGSATWVAFTPAPLPNPLPQPGPGALYGVSANTEIPIGGGIASAWARTGGYVGSDGRVLYPLTRSGATNSYFPAPFEVTLFELVFNENMFPIGTALTVAFKIATQLVNADTEAQWVLVIEKGLFTADTLGSPDTDDTNLGAVNWDTTNRILKQRLILSSALETGGFGCTIANLSSSVSVTSASTSSYTVTVASIPSSLTVGATLLGGQVTAITSSTKTLTLAQYPNQAISSPTPVNYASFPTNALQYQRIIGANLMQPSCATFALRARLLNFDTKDSTNFARGWASWALQTPDNGTLGAVIQTISTT